MSALLQSLRADLEETTFSLRLLHMELNRLEKEGMQTEQGRHGRVYSTTILERGDKDVKISVRLFRLLSLRGQV